MLNNEELGFHDKYVIPFYGGLMNLNFTRREVCANPKAFLDSVRQLRIELTNDEILQLLNHNWRPSKVGAWIIGLCEISELKKDLIEFLDHRPTYCEHVIINLILFNSKDGNIALREYIYNQLKLIQKLTLNNEEYNSIQNFERNSIICGFDGLNYLDSINSTNHFYEIINSEIWNSIKNEWDRISKINSRAKGFLNVLQKSEQRNGRFDSAMQLIKEN